MPESTLAALDDLDAWPLGPHDNAGYPELFRAGPAPGGVIRKRFDLYANIRAARALSPAVKSTCPRMDVVVVREDTEGF